MARFDGIAKLDLSGNRVIWNNGTKEHNRILLEGSHFSNTVLVTTIVVSGICGLAFVVILFSLCFLCCGRGNNPKYLPWATVWVPMLCMIGFFVLDLVNRVYHEMEQIMPVEWIAIDIPLGALTSIADATLMIYFTKHSPVQINRRSGLLPWFIMYGAILVYSLSSVAAKGVQIWNLILQIDGKDVTDTPAATIHGSNDNGLSSYLKALAAFERLSTASAGILLGFAIGLATLAFLYTRRLSETHVFHKRLVWTVGILATCYLIRNAVSFVFWLLYSQLHHIAGLGIQLVYMAFYGVLSVCVYLCIVLTAVAQGKEDDMPNNNTYGSTEQGSVGEGAEWAKQQYFVRQAPIPRLDADIPQDEC